VPEPDLVARGRGIIDSNLYLVLGTADAQGGPWVSPVYFAHADYREFFWVSSPDTQHSRNLVERPEVSIVIFDSQAAIGTGQAVYLSASAKELTGDERAAAMELFSRRSLSHGGAAWTVDHVQPPARLRPYRATSSAQYVLDANDQRVPVSL
jgi:nitroimidazol reductase NimA-like FMN-containing flavoprotein (pyridoxamine 5'-phosphate oxidase superfamily)